jgi:osmotically-inducible protein OsmY
MGVSHIENNLHVYLEEIADRNLASDVEEELDWNAFVDRDNIELSVGRGMVTLTGEVDSIRSFREAAAAARAAGAEVVFNRLKIAPATLSPKEEKKDS